MLGCHKMLLTTYQTGDVINIFAWVKIWPWLQPWYNTAWSNYFWPTGYFTKLWQLAGHFQ